MLAIICSVSEDLIVALGGGASQISTPPSHSQPACNVLLVSHHSLSQDGSPEGLAHLCQPSPA